MKTTKDELIKTAMEMFSEKGYSAVSMSMIAEKAGITKGALYRHFESKQEIFDSIIDKMFRLDGERAEEDSVPVNTYEDNPSQHQGRKTVRKKIGIFS